MQPFLIFLLHGRNMFHLKEKHFAVKMHKDCVLFQKQEDMWDVT